MRVRDVIPLIVGTCSWFRRSNNSSRRTRGNRTRCAIYRCHHLWLSKSSGTYITQFSLLPVPEHAWAVHIQQWQDWDGGAIGYEKIDNSRVAFCKSSRKGNTQIQQTHSLTSDHSGFKCSNSSCSRFWFAEVSIRWFHGCTKLLSLYTNVTGILWLAS